MIEGYLSQQAVLLRCTGVNEYGESITIPLPIQVRWQAITRLVRDTQGKEVVSEAKCFCTEVVQIGDSIRFAGRDWPVISVVERVDLSGSTMFWEVAL